MSRQSGQKPLSIHVVPRSVAAPAPSSAVDISTAAVWRRTAWHSAGIYDLLRRSPHHRAHVGDCGHQVELYEVRDREQDHHIMVHADICFTCHRARVVRCPEVGRYEIGVSIRGWVDHLKTRHGWTDADFPDAVLKCVRGMHVASSYDNGEAG